MCYERRDPEQALACWKRDQKNVFYAYCFICGKPIRVGDKAYEIGIKERDKELICHSCRESIVEHDTEVDGDG